MEAIKEFFQGPSDQKVLNELDTAYMKLRARDQELAREIAWHENAINRLVHAGKDAEAKEMMRQKMELEEQRKQSITQPIQLISTARNALHAAKTHSETEKCLRTAANALSRLENGQKKASEAMNKIQERIGKQNLLMRAYTVSNVDDDILEMEFAQFKKQCEPPRPDETQSEVFGEQPQWSVTDFPSVSLKPSMNELTIDTPKKLGEKECNKPKQTTGQNEDNTLGDYIRSLL